MEMIMDYHLVFIAIVFLLLLVTIVFLFVNNTKEKTMAALILAALNWLICLICCYGFFRIGLVGYAPDASVEVGGYLGMYPLWAIFYLIHLLNIVFIYYCYWLWVRNPWKIGETGSSEVNAYNQVD